MKKTGICVISKIEVNKTANFIFLDVYHFSSYFIDICRLL